MWKRDDAVKPTPPGGPAAAGSGQNPQNNINTSPAPEAAPSNLAVIGRYVGAYPEQWLVLHPAFEEDSAGRGEANGR